MGNTAIAEAKARHEAELLALPNVTGVGIGERDGKPVIKVFVTEKCRKPSSLPRSACRNRSRATRSTSRRSDSSRRKGNDQEVREMAEQDKMELTTAAAAKIEGAQRQAVDEFLNPRAAGERRRRRRRVSSGQTGSRPASRRCSSSSVTRSKRGS